MDIQRLRQSLRIKWLNYYRENRHWLALMGVWVNCDGQRRPSSSFILASLSVLEPQLTQILPLIVDLNHNPDRIVRVLGLNFNPEIELEKVSVDRLETDKSVRFLPGGEAQAVAFNSTTRASSLSTAMDEACRGSRQEATEIVHDRE
ncbi:DUF5331 domain-containing protein [Neosynechococcus sphagnicola]|uniref:DUF5331 domain-containing protein n=1 Tax=Neosynechococcus sphagnicola TaxID=1501145 RepID=UPI00138E3CDD|nr:DUF5331 domain-containing protein [Neosynechococcus sphagnicola]